MTHFATTGSDRSPAETELASALASTTALVDEIIVLGLLVAGAGRHTRVLFVAVLGIASEDPSTP